MPFPESALNEEASTRHVFRFWVLFLCKMQACNSGIHRYTYASPKSLWFVGDGAMIAGLLQAKQEGTCTVGEDAGAL